MRIDIPNSWEIISYEVWSIAVVLFPLGQIIIRVVGWNKSLFLPLLTPPNSLITLKIVLLVWGSWLCIYSIYNSLIYRDDLHNRIRSQFSLNSIVFSYQLNTQPDKISVGWFSSVANFGCHVEDQKRINVRSTFLCDKYSISWLKCFFTFEEYQNSILLCSPPIHLYPLFFCTSMYFFEYGPYLTYKKELVLTEFPDG